MIYFIKSPSGPIKIGTTIRLSERLRQLAVEYGPGLEVLAVTDGSYETEKGLHAQFSHLRQVGEWFEPGDDLVGCSPRPQSRGPIEACSAGGPTGDRRSFSTTSESWPH